MRLYGVRIFVSDFDRARRFYGGAMELKENWAMPEAGAVGFDLGSAELIVERQELDGEDADLVGRFVGVSIKVDDIDEVFARLTRRGVAFQAQPEKQTWGGMLAHFEDPDGNILTLLG